jgi:hypothetical protein
MADSIFDGLDWEGLAGAIIDKVHMTPEDYVNEELVEQLKRYFVPKPQPDSSSIPDKKEYLPWQYAGGPNQCKHGYAAGIPCPDCNSRSRSYHEGLLKNLSDPTEAMAYVQAAIDDSPEAFWKAVKNVAEARDSSSISTALCLYCKGTKLDAYQTLHREIIDKGRRVLNSTLDEGMSQTEYIEWVLDRLAK